MNSLTTYCHVSNQIARHTDVDESPIENVFDHCSPLNDIYEALITDRKVTFQAGWSYLPSTYTAYDILLDRITDDVDAGAFLMRLS